MARRSRETLVRHAQELNQDALLGYPNVIGIATGFRERDGKVTEDVVVQVFVSRKVAEAQLNPADVVPKRVSGWEGPAAQTDVIETTVPAAQQDTTRYRPVEAGSSIGPEASVSAGISARGRPSRANNASSHCRVVAFRSCVVDASVYSPLRDPLRNR